MPCLFKSKVFTLAVFGILIAAAGFVMYIIFPIVMENEIQKKLVLKEGTKSFENWKNINVPIYLHFYFFNITNKEEIYNLSGKPVLQQLGPYTYREQRNKEVISSNKNGTITYRQFTRWYYEPDMSNGSLDDVITTLNVPMMAAAMKAKQINSIAAYFAMTELFAYYESRWFVEKRVRQLLFEGYEDPLMKMAEQFIHLPFDKFGWFYKRNDTDSGEYNIFSGQNDIENLDVIDTWNGKKNVSAFHSYCGMINGTAGDFWSPNLTTSSKVTFFVTDICRSMSFTYLTDVSVKGVRAYRYFSDKTQLDNGKYDPNNKCFCDEEACLPAGAVNVSICKFEAPAVVSYPHFLYADPIYGDGVIGLNPDPDKHQMFLDIVPELGVPVRVAARMQINIVFEAIPEIMQFQNITQRIYFPVLWFSEDAIAGEDITSQFKLILTTVPLISQIFSYLAVITGIILTALALYMALRNRVKRREPTYTVVQTS